MEKRGQIYILAAIILVVVIFGISRVYNTSSFAEFNDDFEKLSNNYEYESSKLINSLLESGDNIEESFNNFSAIFTAYSKSQNPNFGLIFALYSNDVLYLGNYLDQFVIIDCEGCNKVSLLGCFDSLPATITFEGLTIEVPEYLNLVEDCTSSISKSDISEIFLTIDGNAFTFNINPDKPEVIIVSREDLADITKVFMGGNFKKEQADLSITGSEYCNPLDQSSCSPICIWSTMCDVDCTLYKYENGCLKDPSCCWSNGCGTC